MATEPAWNVDFLDLIDLLLAENVAFAVVGAFVWHRMDFLVRPAISMFLLYPSLTTPGEYTGR